MSALADLTPSQITNISCAQRWPWNGKVDINYTLSSSAAYPVFPVAFYGQIGNGEEFALNTLEGDGACGVTFILCLYVLRQHRVLQAAVGFGLLPMKWLSAPAFIPMNMYNGRRGFIRGTVSKYAFYAYYPFHLLVLYHLRCYTMTA